MIKNIDLYFQFRFIHGTMVHGYINGFKNEKYIKFFQ